MSEDANEVDIDIDEREGQLREAAGKVTTAKFRGEILEFPPPKAWSPSAHDAIADGDLMLWLELVLGAEQFAKISDPEPPMYVLEDIFDGITKKNGMNPKKSGSSSQRSGKKARR